MSGPKLDLRRELTGQTRDALIRRLTPDEQAAVEASTGDMGNKPEAVRLGWLKMRTREPWTRQRYALTVGRALKKLRAMVEERSPGSE